MQLEHTNVSIPTTEVSARYLEAIFYMEAEGEVVRSARLADWLGVSRPTVTMALRRMERDRLIGFGAHKVIALTARGREAASGIVRRHRIVERWLTDQLGLDWLTADEEAARLEHAVSDRVENRMYESLGRPRVCPHGNPIPGSSEIDPREVRLSVLGEGTGASVSRISEVAEREAPALLTYLDERHLVPGASLRVLEVDDIGGTLRIQVAGREVSLSPDTAARVWVLPESA